MINLLKASYPISLVLFFCLVVGVVRNFKDSFVLFKGISRKALLFLVVILLVSVVLRIYAVPHRHWVFYDEYEHINVAKNMLEEQLFSRCNFYLDGKCLSSWLTQWPPGYHFLLSVLFGIFGVSEPVAYNFNIFLSCFSILLIFLATYLITQKDSVSLVSALLLSFAPLHLRFSANSSLEMASLVFLLSSFLALLIFTKEQTSKSLFQLASVSAYAILIRPENGIILFLFPLFLAMHRVKMRNFLSSGYLSLAFIPYFLYLPHIRRMLHIESLDDRLFENTWQRFFHNAIFLLNNYFNPLVCLLMAAVGYLYLSREKRKICVWLCFYAVVFFLIYTLIHKASLASEDRYNLQFYFPVIIFAAAGLYASYLFLRKFLKNKWLVIILLSLITFLSFFQKFSFVYVKSKQSDDEFFQKQHNMFLNGREIDEDCVFVSYNPSSVISTLGRSAVHIYYLFDKDIYEEYLRNRRLILVDDYWCQKDRAGYCNAARKKYILEKMGSGKNMDLGLFYSIKEKS